MMVSTGNGDSVIQSLISGVAGNKLEIYTKIISNLLDDCTKESVLGEVHQQSSNFCACLCRDITAGESDVTMAALQVLGMCPQDGDIVEAFSKADRLKALEATCQVILETTDRSVCTRALWCLTSQTNTEGLLGNEVDAIVAAIECALCTKNFKSMTVEYEGLNAIITLLEIAPEEMSPLAPRWAKMVYPLLLHGAFKIRERAVVAMDLGLPLVREKQQCVGKCLMADLRNKDKTPSIMLEQLTKLMNTKQEIFALRVWKYYVQLLGSFLHRGQLINQLLPYVEQAFRNPSAEVKCAAYHAWRALICNFAINPSILSDGKRVKLVMQVFNRSNAKVESVAVEKLRTWWFFVCKLGNKTSTFDTVVCPLLNYCVGIAKPTQPSSMSRIGLLASPLNANQVASPLPQFRRVHLEGAQVLGRILGSPLADNSGPVAQFTIDMPTEELITGPIMFVKHAELIIESVRKCFENLEENLHDGLLFHIWYSLLAHIKNVLNHSNKNDATQVLSMFLTALRSLLFGRTFSSLKLLKLIQATLCLPSRILSSSTYTVVASQSGMEKSAVRFLLDLLFSQPMLDTSCDHERFFVLFEKLAACGMSDTRNALCFMKGALQLVDGAPQQYVERESIWRMWTLLVNPLLQHILKTNEVNGGDVLEHDFSCLYAALQLPLLHLVSSDFSVQALRSMFQTWSELYTTFARLAALVPNAEANICFEELSSLIVDMLDNNPDKFKEIVCVDTLSQVCQVMLTQVDYSGFKSGTSQFGSSALLSPGKFMTKKKQHPLGNLHSFVKLVGILTSGLTAAGHRSQQDTKSVSGPALQTAAIVLLDVLTTLFTHLPNSGSVANTVKRLAPSVGLLYEMSTARPTNKLYSQQVLLKLEKLWLDMVTCIQARYQGAYDSEFLAHLMPLLSATFLHPRRPIRNQTNILWNATFSTTATLVYPATLKAVLVKVREKTPISLPGWDVTSITLIEETQVSQMGQGPESQVELPNMAGLQSPHKSLGSFMHKVVSPKVRNSPLKAHKTLTSSARKKLGLDDMNTQDFVVITQSARRPRVLTPHQREVLQERKVLPAMYNNLDASQDRSLMSQLGSSSIDSPLTSTSQTPFSFVAATKAAVKLLEKPQEAENAELPVPQKSADKSRKAETRRRSVTFMGTPTKSKKVVDFTSIDESSTKNSMVLLGQLIQDSESDDIEVMEVSHTDLVPDTEGMDVSAQSVQSGAVVLVSDSEVSELPTQESETLLRHKPQSAGRIDGASDTEGTGRDTREKRKSPWKKPNAEGMKRLENWFGPSKASLTPEHGVIKESQNFSPGNFDVLIGLSTVVSNTSIVQDTEPNAKDVSTEKPKETKQLCENISVILAEDTELVSQVPTSKYTESTVKESQEVIRDSEPTDVRLHFKPIVQLERLDDFTQGSFKTSISSSVETSSDDGVHNVTAKSSNNTIVRKLCWRDSPKLSSVKESTDKTESISQVNMDDIIPSSQDSYNMDANIMKSISSSTITANITAPDIENSLNDSNVEINTGKTEKIIRTTPSVTGVSPLIFDKSKDSSSSPENNNAIQNPDIIPADLSTSDSIRDNNSTLTGRTKRRNHVKKTSEESIIDPSQNAPSISASDNSSQEPKAFKMRPARQRSLPNKFNDSEINSPKDKKKKRRTINLRPEDTLTDCSSEAPLGVASSLSQDSNQIPKENNKISEDGSFSEPSKEILALPSKIQPEEEAPSTDNKPKTENEDIQEIIIPDSRIPDSIPSNEEKKNDKSSDKQSGVRRVLSSKGKDAKAQLRLKRLKKIKKLKGTEKTVHKIKEVKETKVLQNIVNKECNLDLASDAEDDLPINLLTKKPSLNENNGDDDLPLSFLKSSTEPMVIELKSEKLSEPIAGADVAKAVLTLDNNELSEDVFKKSATQTSTPAKVIKKRQRGKRGLNLNIDMVTSPVNKQLRSKKLKVNRSMRLIKKHGHANVVKQRQIKHALTRNEPTIAISESKDDSQEQIDLMKGTEISSSEESITVIPPTIDDKQETEPEPEKKPSPSKPSSSKIVIESPRRSPRKLGNESPQKTTLSPTRRSLNQSLDLPETPTSGTKHPSRASLILERSRLFAPQTTVIINPKKRYTALKPAAVVTVMEDLISPSKSILKPTPVSILPEAQASPVINTTNSPSFRPLQLPRIYSPSASPSAGILKKRKLCNEVATDSPSPPHKQRRVSFNEAVDICQLSSKDPSRPVNRCLVMPGKCSRLTSPLVFCTVTASHSKVMTLPNQQTSDTDFVVPHPVNKKSPLPACTAESSQSSARNTAELNNDAPIFPDLMDCSEPIDQILPQLTSSTWIRGLGQLLRAKNIRTVGDLCTLTEYDVNNLPIRTPKVVTVRQVLEAYSTQQQLKKPKDQPTQDTSDITVTEEDTSKVLLTSEPLPSVEEALKVAATEDADPDTSMESISEMHLNMDADTSIGSNIANPEDIDNNVSLMEAVGPPNSAPTEHEYFFRDPMGTAASAGSPTQNKSFMEDETEKLSLDVTGLLGDTKEKASSRSLLKEMEAMAKKLTPEILTEMPASYLVAMHKHLNAMMANVIAVQSNQCPLSPGSQLSQSQL